MTGTAVNPLFRAAYLAKAGHGRVTLFIPWLSLKEQELVYPSGITFSTPLEQEAYIRQWLEEKTGFSSDFNIRFYPGRFSTDKRSILAVGDNTELVPDEEADIAVLEEPEHLTWYHHGRSWKTKFRRVIGVVHTNYIEYVKREKNGRVQAFFLNYVNNWVTQIYCHKVIRLSAATQDLPRSVICNVHGVGPKFLEVGLKKQEQQKLGGRTFSKGAYYIGKMVWSKGYKELLQLLSEHQSKLADFEIDLYGNGEDSVQIREAARKLSLTINVYPGRDHADPLFHEYKVFINPSTTDVVCTTTAEALAMGKIVICADHVSNDFFREFPNCRTYKGSNGFPPIVRAAMESEPLPLSDELRHRLSWEAATERFVKAAELNEQSLGGKVVSSYPSKGFMSISFEMSDIRRFVDDASAFMHNAASGIEPARRAFGAIPKTLYPDEQQCRELGLKPNGTNKSGKQWFKR
ncbi:hypothetical protein AMTR_s00101p00147880 [Amborella trichopoda]|uniref:Digalactosyldiacylglycerol synthase 2, chloroplastic n=2 Tax=Amborella trichopoda TaxID=13333 RepID=W1NV36_AMBTC|nr:hypothetical protein AMTR_s00101p00147880 [Amborella trichopoda]